MSVSESPTTGRVTKLSASDLSSAIIGAVIATEQLAVTSRWSFQRHRDLGGRCDDVVVGSARAVSSSTLTPSPTTCAGARYLAGQRGFGLPRPDRSPRRTYAAPDWLKSGLSFVDHSPSLGRAFTEMGSQRAGVRALESPAQVGIRRSVGNRVPRPPIPSAEGLPDQISCGAVSS